MTGLRRQRGVAMVLLLAMISMGTTWLVVSRLNAASNDWLAAKRAHNTRVLAKAKHALIGYVAAQANKAFEDNPGSLPCPEDPGNFDSAHSQGKVGSGCASSLKVGRFPWRTLGLDKLVDADGEPLWYVVSTAWGPGAVINSNTTAGLTVDGVANAAIAIIVAPGASLNVESSSGCTAWNQARTTTGTPDWRNYLECENATSPADAAFVTTGPSGAFNDQVITLKVAEIMPAIEASISNRIEREIAPALSGAYTAGSWGLATGTQPVYPFPAPFANPDVAASFQGSAASCSGNACSGLLPLIFTNTPGATSICTPDGSSLCDPLFVKWASGTIEVKSVVVNGTTYVPGNISGMIWTATLTDCSVSTTGTPQSTYLDCNANVPSSSGVITTNVIYEVRGVAANVGMTLRRFDAAASLPGITVTTAPTVSMASSGSATMTFRGSTTAPTSATVVSNSECGLSGTMLPGVHCRRVTVSVPIVPLFPDHALVNSSDDTVGWFVRNGWHKLTYYAIASGHSPAALPADRSCATGTSCLTISSGDPARPITANAARAILVLGGRSINGSARPSTALTDYFEYGNATGRYERQRVSPVSLTPPYADTGTANAYVISASVVTQGKSLYWRAANTNTGASTLYAPGVGAAIPLANVDGSPLVAGQIPANGIVEVTYDGARFTVRKSPFNDRVVVVSSN